MFRRMLQVSLPFPCFGSHIVRLRSEPVVRKLPRLETFSLFVRRALTTRSSGRGRSDTRWFILGVDANYSLQMRALFDPDNDGRSAWRAFRSVSPR